MQTHEDGSRHPITFWRKTLNAAEHNYRGSERERLAVIWAIRTLRPYLYWCHYTDHRALNLMLDLTDVSARLERWRLCFLELTALSITRRVPTTLLQTLSLVSQQGPKRT